MQQLLFMSDFLYRISKVLLICFLNSVDFSFYTAEDEETLREGFRCNEKITLIFILEWKIDVFR